MDAHGLELGAVKGLGESRLHLEEGGLEVLDIRLEDDTAFSESFNKAKFEAVGINIVSYNQMGSVATFIVRGDRMATEEKLRCMNPLLLDILPLNLEEVFVYEMEALGYVFKDILM